jgi:acyl-CoA thioesterase
MDSLRRFAERDAFARTLGIKLLEYGEGYAKTQLHVEGRHLNSVSTVHGGAVFALADAAFSVASNSHGTVAVSIHASISYFKALAEGTLTATARQVSRNPKLATYLIEVCDSEDTLVALFQGTVYRKARRLDEVEAQSNPPSP